MIVIELTREVEPTGRIFFSIIAQEKDNTKPSYYRSEFKVVGHGRSEEETQKEAEGIYNEWCNSLQQKVANKKVLLNFNIEQHI